MKGRKWRPIIFAFVPDELGDEEHFKGTINLDGFELLLFADGTYAGRMSKIDLKIFKEKKKNVELIDKIPIIIHRLPALISFLAKKDYGFSIHDLEPQKPDIMARLFEKNRLACYDFDKYLREKYWEQVQIELEKHPLP